jgi:DNA-binding CsgD family transcriptional regulator
MLTSISCALLWVLTPLLIILAVIAWATETNRDRARRWRRQGLSQQRIAERLGCSRWRVRQLLV